MTAEFVNSTNNGCGYSMFNQTDKDVTHQQLFNDENPMRLLHWPDSDNQYSNEDPSKLDPGSQDGNQNHDSADHNITVFAPQYPWSRRGRWSNSDGKFGHGKEVNEESSDITDDIHKRLQDQLALKQLEVQDIQQTIAKTKRWGDPRKGLSDRHRNVSKAITRPLPEPANAFPVFDLRPKERKSESIIEGGSTLDPNSPCFYPSFNPPTPAVGEVGDKSQPWLPFGNVHKGLEYNKHDQLPNGNGFNPFYPDYGMPSQEWYPKLEQKSNTFCETYTFENKAGVISKPVFHSRWDGGNFRNSFQKKSNRDNYNNIMSRDQNDFDKCSKINYAMHRNDNSVDTMQERYPMTDKTQRTTNTNYYEELKLSIPDFDDANYSHGVLKSKLGFLATNQNPITSAEKNNALNLDGNFDKRAKSNYKGSHNGDYAPDCMDVPYISTFNGHGRSRLRIVRKIRPEINSGWKTADDCQPSSSNVHCPSCKLYFQWPHTISCFHSFCFSCITKNFDKEKETIKCPTCSTETALNGTGPEQLHLDFLTCKTLYANGKNPFSCMACPLDKQAETYCQECMQYICSECKGIHETNVATSSHQMINAKKAKEIDGQHIETCLEHRDNKLERFCDECKKLVCNVCISPGESHDQHRLGDVTQAYPLAINRIKTINSQLDQMKHEVQKRIQPLTILKQDIETSIRLCKQDIHKYSNSLLAETEKCRSKARMINDKAHEDFTKEMEAAQDLMIQYLAEHSPLNALFRRYIFSATPQDFMAMAPSIQSKILRMKSQYEELRRYEGIFDTTVQFKPDYAGLNEYLQNQYNQIRITENLSDALPSHSSEMGRRIEQEILAGIERKAKHFPRTNGTYLDNDPKEGPGIFVENDIDPQSEMFNYKRTSIDFIHQFGDYGRGEYEFVEPSGVLYLLDGSLAVCDTANHRIMIYDDQFNYVRTIGQPPNLPPLRDQKDNESRNDRHLLRSPQCLYFPYRIAQCPRTENIVVIERPPSRDIQIFSIFGQFIMCFGSDILQHPRGVAVDEHGVIVTVEGRTMKLMLFSQEGKLLHKFYLSVHLEFPNDVAARDGFIYISDNRGHCVHVFDYNAEPKHTIGNESVTYYPIGVSLTHRSQVVVTDNHNTFNISVFNASDGRYLFGFKSRVRHANCYNVAVHPHRLELAVTSRENQVVIFNFEHLQEDEERDKNAVFEKQMT